jgi:olefin beta-lactone synthetase
LHSPYGATEALPVASVSSSGIEDQKSKIKNFFGACVGRPVPEVDVRIIALRDEPVATFAQVCELPRGEIGEIVVRGPVVSKHYDALPAADAQAKIADGPAIWHRMGDCGYLDVDGRLWFCGRKVERVETEAGPLHTEPCEQVFRAHPRVARCALIGLRERSRQRPAIVVESDTRDSRACRAFARELRLLALEYEHTRAIKVFFFRRKFPVDVRHNAKIHRLALARWAATAKGYESDPKR